MYLREEFRTLVTEEGEVKRYTISNYGRVFDTKNNSFVSQVLTGGTKYFYVNIKTSTNRVLRRVHNLLAKAFIPNPDNLVMVDHIDRNPYNNTLDNLRWVTRKQNARNTKSNIYLNGVLLKEFCLKYDAPDTAYNYIVSRKGDLGLEEAVLRYERSLTGVPLYYSGPTINYFCNFKVNLKMYCDTYKLDYQYHKYLFDCGCTNTEVLYGIRFKSYLRSFQCKKDDTQSGVMLWIPSKRYAQNSLGCSDEAINLMTACEVSYSRAKSNSKNKLLLCHGDYLNMAEICLKYNTTYSRIRSRLEKGYDLDSAVLLSPLKTYYYSLDGIRMKKSELINLLGLSSKKVNNYQAKNQIDLQEALIHFGIDISKYKIIPL